MFKQILQASTALAALVAAQAASAGVITATTDWYGEGSVHVDAVTISAYTDQAGTPGTIGVLSIPGVGTGAGVQGQDNHELDWYSTSQGADSEVLSFDFLVASRIDSLQLGLLFDGPEYTDFQEGAGFRVTFADNTQQTYSLATQYPGGYSWNGSGSWSGTGLSEGFAGLWTAINPFGDRGVLRIDMFATEGTCGTSSACRDQSDYVFHSLRSTIVPEPGTLALLGAGLLAMGWVARRGRIGRESA